MERSVRRLLWGLMVVVLVTSGSHAAWSNDTTLSACEYPSDDYYVASAAQMQVPTVGYLACSNATGSDVELCATCTCREKKTASTEGITVAWIVCVEAQDQATCVNYAASSREYCASSNVDGAINQNSSSSSGDGFGVDVGDSFGGSNSRANGSDSNAIEAGVDAASGLNSGSTSSSSDSGVNVHSSTDTSASTSAVETLTLPPQKSQGTNEDNVITGVVGTVEPLPTTGVTSTGENIIRPSGSNALDTTTSSSNASSWSSERLTVVASVMCGIAAVAAIAVFVAGRHDRAKKRKMPGTPADDFTDDDSALATPMTKRFDGSRGVYRYNNHSRQGNRYYGAGERMSDDAPLAPIVVIGPGDGVIPPASYASPHCQPYDEARRKPSQGVSRSRLSSRSGGTTRPQSSASRGSSMSSSPEPEPALDTTNTKVSFSSSTSSAGFTILPSDRGYASEDGSSLNDSFRLVSATYSETDDPDTYSTSRGPPSFRTTNDVPADNTIVSFESSLSSLSSLNSSQYDIRDTEASEYMHDSEDGMMYTNSSRVPMSFDVGSVSTEFN